MWDDEDNNPYASFERRDSDFDQPDSPVSRYNRASTPPSEQEEETEHGFAHDPLPAQDDDEDEEADPRRAQAATASRPKDSYESRVERLLYEHPDLTITITTAGKNTEGGGSYIVYTIRTHDIEVRRRYSDFYSLRHTLVTLHPTLIIPPIPEKHTVADYAAKPTKAREDEAIIEHRKRMLTSFLNRCRRMKGIREDGVFWKFLDPNASWSEVLHSPPISTLPKSNLKVPPLNATNPSPGHNFLPVPAANARLKSSKIAEPSGTPIAQQNRSSLPSSAAHTAPGPQIFGKFPPPTHQLPESELDPYFVNFEQSSRELEALLQGNVEKVNKRTISHFNSYAEDLAELGARFNGFSLSESSQTLAAAIEKMGQAVDSTYIATGELSGSLSAGFCEPMRESAQFASIVRNVLRYRILKRVQEEMTRDELDKKKALLGQLEFSEQEAKRIDQHLESSGFLPPSQLPKRSLSASTASSARADRQRGEEDTASIDSDFPPNQTAPSAAQGAPSRSEPGSPLGSHRKSGSGNFVTNKIFGRINHAIHGMVDVDPERTRRDQMGKTKESLVQLEQALEVSVKDVRDASAGVMDSLKEFQSEKEDDLRRYMIAYAKAHIAWAKKNVASWEEAKLDVDAIQAPSPKIRSSSRGRSQHQPTSSTSPPLPHAPHESSRLAALSVWLLCSLRRLAASVRSRSVASPTGAASARQFLAKTSYPKKRRITYSRHSTARTPRDDSLFAESDAPAALTHADPRTPASPSIAQLQTPRLPLHPPTDAAAIAANHFSSPAAAVITSLAGRGMSDHSGQAFESPQDAQHPVSPVHRTASDLVRFGAGLRSASPAKRSRSERDADGDDSDTSINSMSIDRSPSKKLNAAPIQSPLPSRTKAAPPDMTGQQPESGNTSIRGDAWAGSVSSESNAVPVSSPPTSVDMDGDVNITTSPPSYDEQRDKLDAMICEPLTEGHKGYVVPKAWLDKILAKATSKGQQKENFSKEAVEDEVGPIDTRSILASSAQIATDFPKDGQGNSIALLAPGLSVGGAIELLPKEAWDLVISWYGLARGSPPVIRFVVNTNDDPEGLPNLLYELYPTLFTLQKLVNEAGQGLESIGERGRKAVQLVASRSEKYHHFLKRVKAALDLPAKRKVQVWKILEVLQAGTGRAGIPTPISSRGNSPAPPSAAVSDLPSLTVDTNALAAMPEGTQRELLDLPDETTNEKYNGNFRLGQIGFPERQTLVVESTWPTSGDLASQKSTAKKTTDSSSQPMAKSSSSSSATTSRPSANTRSSQASNTARSIFSARGRRDRKGRVRGSVGLQNLGNTCYMNSALQCIRSVQELTAYFMKEKYKDDINTDNPLGHNGVIAKGYASLLAQFYSSDGGFAPRAFKSMIGRAQPLFSGYGQQDSQEFVGFLLDALHEDLNRIIKKPYFENPDSDDKRVLEQEYVRELGETYRSNHGKRNDSVVMDLFSGFYKNTMICPVCNKVSVTFDPYAQLTLQLPVENTFTHTFQVVPLGGTRVSVEVDVEKNTTFKSLKDYLAKRVHGIKADHLIFAEEYNEKFYKLFEDAEPLGESGITTNDKIVAYEVDCGPSNWPPLDKKKKKGSFLGLSSFSASSDPVPDMGSPAAERMAIPVFNRLLKGSSRGSWVLYPFFILVTRDEAKDYEAILRKLLLRVNTMTTTDLFSDCEISSVQQSEAEDIGDNKNIPRIQARSVDGDEDFVDVSMTDGKPSTTSAKPSPPSSPSLRAKILDQGTFLPQNVRDAFEISVYTSNTEVVPVGWSTIGENGKFQPLWERAHPRDARRMSNSSMPGRRSGSRNESRWMRGDDASSDMSEDELASSEHGLSRSTPDIRPLTEEDSDGGDTSATEQNLGVKRGSHLKGSNVRGSIKRLGKSMRDSITRSKSRGKPEDYILRLGEALILDWNTDIFESLFGGDKAEDLKGQRTDQVPPTVPDPELSERRERRAARKKQGITLNECFSETSKSEVLSEDNAWYCPSCKEFRRATKTLELWTVPDILIVHLKRFAGSGGRSLNNKVDVLVDFPVDGLDLGGRVGLSEDKSLVYDLFAVDNHYGGLGGGHYTAHAKNFLDGQWYEYNDSFVSKSSGEHAVTKAAYLLFYRRREPKHLGPPSLQHFVEEAVDSDSDEDGSGKDRAGDSLSSGSSEDSGLGGHTSARRLAGPGGGGQRDEKPPEYDEAIAMGDDNDNEAHELEGSSRTQAPGMAFGGQNWGFDRLGQSQGVKAPPGSDNEMGGSDSSTLASDEPNVGEEDLGTRMMEFADTAQPMEGGEGQMAHLPPGTEDSEPIAHVTPMDHEQEDAVAEVRLSDEEKDR